MAQPGRFVRVRAGSGCVAGDPNLNLFTATIAQNAALNGRILLPEAISAGRSAQCIIRSIEVTSVDGNIWEFWFWGNSLFATGDARERFEGHYVPATAGVQIAATGLFHASSTPGNPGLLYIFHEDEDALTTAPPAAGITDPAWRAANGQTGAYLNVTLINRSAGAKTASGYFDVSFVCETTEGW